MKPASTFDDIEAVEKRIEKRRVAVAQRYDEVRRGLDVVVAKASRSWPLVAIGGGLAAGYALSRAPRHAPGLQYATVGPAGMPPTRPVAYDVPTETSHAGMRKIAAVLGLAATAVRIATSSEARALFGAYKAFRARRR